LNIERPGERTVGVVLILLGVALITAGRWIAYV
jgi:hypothetical protein